MDFKYSSYRERAFSHSSWAAAATASPAEPRRSIKSGVKNFMAFSSTCACRFRRSYARPVNDLTDENGEATKALPVCEEIAEAKAAPRHFPPGELTVDSHPSRPRRRQYLHPSHGRPRRRV